VVFLAVHPSTYRTAGLRWGTAASTSTSPGTTSLRDREDHVLLFARDLSVPFTNNQAERDVRPTKTQMKISGCHRSETTAKAWLRVRGYISTVAKHGDNILDALREAITGKPWKPPLAC
jgi:transposase